ncbi:UDP-3-O-(3-hydroxymyristoyl)glucosamine N-acyltransferase [Psychrilyobacter sp.]|uniref:UDP-3-O-(3-hydroxymyristoyl)glucosamine N-acyltransferase n=1 Tax=Psychrilyobacter sp. TaxID=2586924 RepID=UPI003016452B
MYNLEKLSTLLGGKIKGDRVQEITGLAPFFQAKKGEVTFAAEDKFLMKLEKTDATVLVVPKLKEYLLDKTYIVVEKNPRELMPLLLKFFKKEVIFPIKAIEDSAIIGERVKIAPNVYIGHGAKIGNDVILHPNVYIGQDVVVGDGSIIYPNAVIREFCILGKNCILQPGAIIGSDGFGYTKVDGNNIKIEQIGRVILENEVEIGANTTIDRGAIGDTIIKKYTKIDNLVQLGHNGIIGENCFIISQVGIAGSTEVGDNCTLAGQVGVAGHIKIGDNVVLGAKSGVTGNISSNQILSGNPPVSVKEHLKIKASLKKLPELVKKVKRLEKN